MLLMKFLIEIVGPENPWSNLKFKLWNSSECMWNWVIITRRNWIAQQIFYKMKNQFCELHQKYTVILDSVESLQSVAKINDNQFS